MDSELNLFECFGGIRPMADKLNEKPSNVQSWKATGRIPAGKQPGVLEVAAALELDVTPEDVIFPLNRRLRVSIVLAPAGLSTECPLPSSLQCNADFVAAETPTVACEKEAVSHRRRAA